MVQIVLNPDREMFFRLGLRQVVIYRFHHRRSEFFRGQPVTPSNDRRRDFHRAIPVSQTFLHGSHDIQVQRFSRRA